MNTRISADIKLTEVRSPFDLQASLSALSEGRISDVVDAFNDDFKFIILTGWAQALSEALVYAPDLVQPLLADARPGAAWRAAFRIAEPSAKLAEAIHFLSVSSRAITSLRWTSRVNALQVLCEKALSVDDPVEKLVIRVLRSTFNQMGPREGAESRYFRRDVQQVS
jgi:hypothetical protein